MTGDARLPDDEDGGRCGLVGGAVILAATNGDKAIDFRIFVPQSKDPTIGDFLL